MPEKKELQKTISGKFSIKEAEQIDRTLKDLGINRNQMVREAVSSWLQVKPVTTEFNNTVFFKCLKDIQKIYQEIVETPKFQKKLLEIEKKLDVKELEVINEKFGIFEKRAKVVQKPKKQGRPSTKKKRIKRIK